LVQYIDLNNIPRAEPKLNQEKTRPSARKIAALAISFTFFFTIGYLGYFGYKAAYFLVTSTGNTISGIVKTGTSIVSSSGQENIILLGSDNDQKFTGNPLTQTILVAHVNFDTKTVDLFSIPRDLWVKIPATGRYGKIDQASGYGGLGDAVKVVQDTFGITAQHYAWVGLYGFVKSIDSVGGVNIDALHPVLDNEYPADIATPDNPYGYLRLHISDGIQHMDGATALEYVRSRHEDQTGDFGRTQRQQQLLLSLKEELLSPDFILQIPNLSNDLQGQVKTDLGLTDITNLAQFFLRNKNITTNQHSLTPPNYSRNATSSDGQSIVVADPQKTSELVGQIFGSEAQQTTYQSLSNVNGVVPR
jgi:LCP family protein required for cell wall assembly